MIGTSIFRPDPDRRRRQLRRREPPLHRARRLCRLGVLQPQPARVLQRGQQDAHLRDRRAARAGVLPDEIIVPVASGCQFVKHRKAAGELIDLGLVERGSRVPRLTGAQAAGCSPVATAFAAGEDSIVPVRPNTIARSIAIGNPSDGAEVLRIARDTGGVGRERHRGGARRGDRAAGRDRGHLCGDRRRCDGGGAPQTRACRPLAGRRDGGRLHHRGGPQDRRVRGRQGGGAGARPAIAPCAAGAIHRLDLIARRRFSPPSAVA